MMISPLSFLSLWLLGFIFIAIFELIWILLLTKGIYSEHLGHLLATKKNGSLDPSLTASVTVWAVLSWGLLVFVIPRVDPTSLVSASIVWGGLWGFTIHAVYDITNVATLREWPILITILNIAWGSVMCGVVTLMLSLINVQFFV